MTEDEMVGWHHRLDDSEGQGSLVCTKRGTPLSD